MNMALTRWLSASRAHNSDTSHNTYLPVFCRFTSVDFTTQGASRGREGVTLSTGAGRKSMYSSHRKPAFHLCSAPVVGCLFSRSGVMRRDKTQGDAVQKCWNASAITNSLHFRMNKSQTVRNNRGESQLFKSEHRETHCRTIFCLMLLWKLFSLRGLYAAVQHVPEKYKDFLKI